MHGAELMLGFWRRLNKEILQERIDSKLKRTRKLATGSVSLIEERGLGWLQHFSGLFIT